MLEFLEGESLGERLHVGPPLSPAEAWAILDPLMDVLQHAHEKGIIHRDLKPDNLYLARNRKNALVPKVLDFGVAKLLEGTNPSESTTLVGTPTYMAPEQASAKDVGPWSDVWSMGVIWFQCLSGRLHLDFATDGGIVAVVYQVVSEDPLQLVDVKPEIDPVLSAIIGRALVRDRRARFPSMRAFHAELEGYFDNARTSGELDRVVRGKPEGVPSTGGHALASEPAHRPVSSVPLGTVPGLRKLPSTRLGVSVAAVGLVGVLIALGVHRSGATQPEAEPPAPAAVASPPATTPPAETTAPTPTTTVVPSTPVIATGVEPPPEPVGREPASTRRLRGHNPEVPNVAAPVVVPPQVEPVTTMTAMVRTESQVELGQDDM